jgi:hypothetical protein
MKLKLTELTELCQRATPEQWAKFITGLRVIKIMRDEQPAGLAERLNRNCYEENRKPGIGLVFFIVLVSKKDAKLWRIDSCSCAQLVILGIKTKF